jgi:putative endonuclease
LVTTHFIYILASYRGTLYVGSARNLANRVDQHHAEAVESFSRKYTTDRLVYYEVAESAEAAFARERQIKNWRREKKVALIEAMNPYWEDLSEKIG